MDVALKVRPAFPGTAVETKGVLEGPNAPLDPGPEAFELFVDPTGTHHALDRQPTLFGKGHVVPPALWPSSGWPPRQNRHPRRSGAGPSPAVDDALRRVAQVAIGWIPAFHHTIQDQRRGPRADKHFVAENRFPRALLDNIGVLFEEGTDLLLGRDGLARKDPSLSLLCWCNSSR